MPPSAGEHHGENPERGGDGEILPDDVVDAAVLLRERNAEIAAQDSPHENEILLGKWTVEPVALLQVAPNRFVGSALIRERVARHRVHRDERGGRDEPDGDNPLKEALEGVGQHNDESLGVLDEVRVGVVRIGADGSVHDPLELWNLHVDEAPLVVGQVHGVLDEDALNLAERVHAGAWID